MSEQHSIMDIPQLNSIHCMNLMNILKARKSVIVSKISPTLHAPYYCSLWKIWLLFS